MVDGHGFKFHNITEDDKNLTSVIHIVKNRIPGHSRMRPFFKATETGIILSILDTKNNFHMS